MGTQPEPRAESRGQSRGRQPRAGEPASRPLANGGLSLIEVLVALAIIGLTAATLLGAMTQVARGGASAPLRFAARDLLTAELQRMTHLPAVEPGTSSGETRQELGALQWVIRVTPDGPLGLGRATMTVTWEDGRRSITGATYVRLAEGHG